MSSSSSPRAAARCSVCGAPAVAYLPYARLRLCPRHLAEYVERKVRRVLRRVGALRPGARIVAAVSGGKDSSTMLAALAKLAREAGTTVHGVYLDLGLGEYSARSREAAEAACRAAGVECTVLSVKELVGLTVPELARRTRRPVCSVCGVVKRFLLNAYAVEYGADYVAMGHNADDMIAYAVKSFLSQDLGYIAKLGPATESVKGLAVGRLRPLYEVFERETLLYALVTGMPFLHEECPYRPEAPIEQEIKEMMNRLEEKHPGTKMMTVRRLERNIEAYHVFQRGEVGRCPACGLISAGGMCSFCRLTARALSEPMGSRVREKLRGMLRGD